MKASAKVVMFARINDEKYKFPYVPVQLHRHAVKFPIVWEREGGSHHFDAEDVMGYYARFQNNGVITTKPIGKRLMEPLGKDAVAAYMQFQQLDQDFSRVESGLAPTNIQPEVKKGGKAITLGEAVAKFERDLIAEGKKERAVESYAGRVKNLLRYFATRPNVPLDKITADDIRNFLVWLPKNIKTRPGSGGHINNTQRNYLRDVKIFFTRFHVEFPLANKFWPKAIEKRKRKYSIDSIKAMLAATKRPRHDNNQWAAEDEKDLVHFLLNTGFRDEEVAHAQYGDFNWTKGSINVYPKPEYNWTPKDNESREQDIDLGPKFLARMEKRMKRMHAKSVDLIFPNTKGKPFLNEGLLNVIRRLVKHAGLEDKAGLHLFRKTFGTMVADSRGLEQARVWLGHNDVQTTQDYLAADTWDSNEDSRKRQQQIFDAVGD